MANVILNFVASEKLVSAGVPEYVIITSDVPSTIYYTLDGTTPTLDSDIFIDYIVMPAYSIVTLKALGVDENDEVGAVYEQSYSADLTDIPTKITGAEGYVINRVEEPDAYFGYDVGGAPAKLVDVNIENFDKLQSTAGPGGIGEGTVVNVVFQDSSKVAAKDELISSPLVGGTFNPYAKVILIDNRLDNDIDIILRTHASYYDIYTLDGGRKVRNSQNKGAVMGGGFVRRFYSSQTNTMVSYHYDSLSNRYVKNIQELPAQMKVDRYIGPTGGNQPLVFRWIYMGRQSSY